MTVPRGKIGLIIGTEGQTVRSIQNSSGAKIVISQDRHEKNIAFHGHSFAIRKAQKLVGDIINSHQNSAKKGTSI